MLRGRLGRQVLTQPPITLPTCVPFDNLIEVRVLNILMVCPNRLLLEFRDLY